MVRDCCPAPAGKGATRSPEQTVPPNLGTSTASPGRHLGLDLLTPPHEEPNAGRPSPGTSCAAGALSAPCSVILAWHCAKKTSLLIKSTLDCSCRNQGQYFRQASHLACSNTPFQATATGYNHRRDTGLGGPSTAEVIVAKEHCKRKYTSTQIKFFRSHTGNNLACRTLATRVESHAVTSRSACLTEFLSWIAILIKSLSGHSLWNILFRGKTIFKLKQGVLILNCF